MKHKILWMLFALLVVGCRKDDTDKGYYETELPISLNEDTSLNALSGASGTSFTVNVDIEGDWSASIDNGSGWGSLAVTSRSGDAVSGVSKLDFTGNGLLTVVLQSNIDRSERSGSLIIESSEGMSRIYYTQKSYYSSSVENTELLRLVMGEASSDLVIETMPYEGQGIADVTFTSGGTTAMGTLSENRSTSVAGLYTATGKAYLSLGESGSFTINNLKMVSAGDLRLQFGARQLALDEFAETDFVVQYAIKSSIEDTPEFYDLDYTYCGEGSEWSLVYADIPYSEGSYVDINFYTLNEDGIGFETLIDDISIYQKRAEITPSLTANVESKYYNYVDVCAELVEIPEGTAVDGAEVSEYYFLWSDEAGYSDGDSTSWTKLESTETPYGYSEGIFKSRIENLAGTTTYFMRSVVKLTNGIELLSVIREFETYIEPTTTINRVVPTNVAMTIEASINYDDEMIAEIDERGFYYRLASDNATSNTQVILSADDDFETIVETLTPETEYTIQAYTIVAGTTFSSEEQNVTTLPDPLDLYTDEVLWSGFIQYGVESTFVITIPHNGELESGDVSLNVLTALGEGDVPVAPSGTDIEDVGQGGATIGDTTVGGDFAELYVVESFNEANTTGVEGYKYQSTFTVTGMPVTEGFSSVPVALTRKDVAEAATYKVAVYAADGSLALTQLFMSDYMAAEGISAEVTGADYRTEYTFYDLGEKYYGDSSPYSPSVERISAESTRYNNTSGLRWMNISGLNVMSIEGIYSVSDVENPSEAVLFEVPLPLGVKDLSDYEIFNVVGSRYVANDSTYLGWRTVFSQDGEKWDLATGYYVSNAYSKTEADLPGAIELARTNGYLTENSYGKDNVPFEFMDRIYYNGKAKEGKYATTNRNIFPAYNTMESQTSGSLYVRYSSYDANVEHKFNNRQNFSRFHLYLYPKVPAGLE